jgi:hypothetical protein
VASVAPTVGTGGDEVEESEAAAVAAAEEEEAEADEDDEAECDHISVPSSLIHAR